MTGPVERRHAVLLASVVGLKAAGKQVGISPAQLCQWRKALEAETKERFPRLHHLKGYRRPFPMSPEQIEEAKALRRRGFSFAEIGKALGVSKDTVRKGCAEGD